MKIIYKKYMIFSNNQIFIGICNKSFDIFNCLNKRIFLPAVINL